MTSGRTASTVAAVSVIAMLLLATAPVSDATTVENTEIRAPSVDLSAEVPSSFDMRDHYTVTPVKDQGIYQMCDFFATAACLEQLLLLEGYGEHDLSELFIAGSVFTGYGEPSGDGGDEMWTTTYPSDYIFGSYSWLSALCLIDWRTAPIDDGLAPVTDFTQDYVSDPGLMSEAIARITGFKVLDPQANADAVKSMIMAGYAGSMMIDVSGIAVIDGEMTCNVPWDSAINHIVTVVGWDDDYPKENFYLQPESDGAWLVKNSYGTSLGTYEGDGYMWVSYESYIAPIVLFYDSCEPASDSRHLYSYDHGYSIGSDMAFEGTATAANVFTATGDQVLDAVSFTTFSMSDATYAVQVYVDLRDPTDPTSGTPALRVPVTGGIWAAGAYMVDLGRGVELDEGVTFSVVITFERDGTVYVPLDTDEDEVLMGLHEYYCRPVASAGESFVLADGVWVDVTADGTTNVRIKAYADDAEADGTVTGAVVAVALVALAVGLLSRRRTGAPSPLAQVVPAEEGQLGGGVDLLQPPALVGGHRADLAEDAHALDGLEQLHPDDRLRLGIGIQEVPVQGVGDLEPVQHAPLVVVGQGVALGQQVQRRQLEPELHQRPQHHRRDEPVGRAAEGRVREVDDHRVLAPEGAHEDLGRLPEGEQLQLTRGVDQRVVRAVGVHHRGHLGDAGGHEVRRHDLRPVGAEAVLLHHVVQGDPLADVHVGLVGKRVRPRVQVDRDRIHPGIVQPALVSADQRALAAAGGPDEKNVLHPLHP